MLNLQCVVYLFLPESIILGLVAFGSCCVNTKNRYIFLGCLRFINQDFKKGAGRETKFQIWWNKMYDFRFYLGIEHELEQSYYRPQRSCGKVLFLHLSMILFKRGGSGRYPPLGRPPPETVTAADDGTHPTGMHNWCTLTVFISWANFLNVIT